jgi:hypothetical protein
MAASQLLRCGLWHGADIGIIAGKGIQCLGLEGSRAAVQASAVKQLIRLVNLNDPVNLGRTFDVIWSYEVAEHIHPVHTHTFLATLTQHGDKVVMSAAPPGQGGAGHFNEQPTSYWIAKMSERAFEYDDEFSKLLHTLSEDHSRNMMVFLRRKT